MSEMKTDCLIIGGGLAGLWASREIVNAGLETIMVRNGRGASPWVHGFNNPVREGDSARIFLEDTLRSGHGLCDPELAEALCADSAEIFDEIAQMGLSFNRTISGEYQAIRPLGASFPRVVSIGNETGTAVINRISTELRGRFTDFPAARALKLLKTGDRVTGALIYNLEKDQWFTIHAKAVVLACGGFCGIFPVSTNKRDSGGDGYAMAYDVGAKLCDMEFIQFEPSAAIWPPKLIGTSMITTLFYEGAVLRNRQGERFMLAHSEDGEKVGKDVLARCIAEEVAKGNGTMHGGVWMDMNGVPPQKLDMDYPMYIARYRNVGIDIKTQWIELAPAPHTALGGVRIDVGCRTSVPGLYACGEVIGGLHGANRIGGSAGLETMVFGRRAGRSVVRELADCGNEIKALDESHLVNYSENSIVDHLDELRHVMQSALAAGVGAVRDSVTLSEALHTIKRLIEKTEALHGQNNREVFSLYRLRNDLVTAMMVITAAAERTESIGCHYRSDYPGKISAPYRVILQKSASGMLVAERMELTK